MSNTARTRRVALFNDLTARYSFAEAWVYDRFVAPAVMDMRDAAVDDYLADLPQGARVLEVGCGGGQLAHAVIEQRPDLRWVGLDASKDQIKRARRRNAGHQSAEFVVGDALALPFADQCFDATVSIASIKHWADQGRGLAECVRVLRPGGQLLVVEAERRIAAAERALTRTDGVAAATSAARRDRESQVRLGQGGSTRWIQRLSHGYSSSGV